MFDFLEYVDWEDPVVFSALVTVISSFAIAFMAAVTIPLAIVSLVMTVKTRRRIRENFGPDALRKRPKVVKERASVHAETHKRDTKEVTSQVVA